jgi:acyl-CoA synthetase (AMP-forming)/AMP-acid ligase II
MISSPATCWPKNVQWIKTDSIRSSSPHQYDEIYRWATSRSFSTLQYTSGSTGTPKPAMNSYRSLHAQLRSWETIEPTDTLVSWLSSYHDMGLVDFIIAPCVFSAHCVSMSPISFLKDPSLWMRVASAYRATHVCAPAFGYALAARKTSSDQARQLSLASLKQTICAAGQIRNESLKAFTATFRVAGFDPRTFNCGYGFAEATLVCTGQDPHQRKMPTVLRVDKHLLETQQRAVVVAGIAEPNGVETVTLVGCGRPMLTFGLLIVHPESRQQLTEEGKVGELWIQGLSVASGYWTGRSDTIKNGQFGAQLHGETDPSNTYFRTGDLGSLLDGQLFVTARLQELITIGDRQVGPEEIEKSVKRPTRTSVRAMSRRFQSP